MVPMRAMFEWLGCKVTYWPQNGAIEAAGSGKTINLWVGNSKARVDGQTVALQAAPREINGTAYVPLRFVAVAMGASVDWSESAQTVTVKQGGRTGIMKVGQRGIRTIAAR